MFIVKCPSVHLEAIQALQLKNSFKRPYSHLLNIVSPEKTEMLKKRTFNPRSINFFGGTFLLSGKTATSYEHYDIRFPLKGTMPHIPTHTHKQLLPNAPKHTHTHKRTHTHTPTHTHTHTNSNIHTNVEEREGKSVRLKLR